MSKKLILLLMMLFSMFVCQVRAQMEEDEADPMQADTEEEENKTVYLLKDRHVTVNKDGLKVIRQHNIVKILKRSAIEYAGDIGYEYNSYYSKARLVKAFTKSADGREIEVSQDAVHDTLPRNFQEFNMYSDVKTLNFSMPAVEVNSILDYEIEETESKPIIEKQAWDSYYFDDSEQVEESRYTLDYPASMALNFKSLNITNQPSTNTAGGRTTVSWVLKGLEHPKFESGMPPVNDVRKSVHFSTITSWTDVRDWFGKLAEDKGSMTAEIRSQVSALTSNAPTREAKIRALSLALQKDVRYVGVELGRSAYEPHAAAVSFKNRYGDCKDKSTLLIAMLKEVGVDACLALIKPNYFGTLVTEIPHPGQFNHVVVYIPELELWLDPTAKYYDIDVYPDGLDGCLALPVRRGTNTFVTVPALPAQKDATRSIYEVQLHHDGRCVVREEEQFTGRAGAYQRVAAEEIKIEKRKEQLEKSLEKQGSGERVLDLGNSQPHDLSIPFRSWTTYETERYLERTTLGFSVSLSAKQVGAALHMGTQRESPAGKKLEDRRYDWVAQSGCRQEIVYRITMPQGFDIDEPVEPQKIKLPHGELEAFATCSNGVLEIVCRADRNACRISSDKWKKVRTETENALTRASVSVGIEDEIQKLLSKGFPGRAIARLEEWRAKDPKNPELMKRLGFIYQKCEMTVNAGKAYRAALNAGDRSISTYRALALSCGNTKLKNTKTFNRDAKVEVFKEAATNCTDRTSARYALAAMYMFDNKGTLFGKGAPVSNAVAVLKELARENPTGTRALNTIADCYLQTGDYEKSLEYYEKALEINKYDFEARAGKRNCAAFMGRIDEAIAASADGETTSQAMDLQQMASQLMKKRMYAEAATMLTKANALTTAADSRRDLSKMLKRMAKKPKPDYETYNDLSTPKNALMTVMASLLYEDTDRIRGTFSERLQLKTDDLVDASSALRMMFGGSVLSVRDFTLDLMAGEWVFSETPLEGDHVELKISPPKDLAFSAKNVTAGISCLMRKDTDGKWRTCGIGEGPLYAGALGIAASWCIDHGATNEAAFYVDRIASHMTTPRKKTDFDSDKDATDWFSELDREDFSNKTARVLGYTGAAVASMNMSGPSVKYLKAALALEPDNVLLSRILGDALIKNRAFPEAAKTFASVTARKPNDWRSLSEQLHALSACDRTAEALALLPKLKDTVPSAQQYGTSEVMAYMDAGRAAEAMKSFTRVKGLLNPLVASGVEAMLFAELGRKDELLKIAEDPNSDPVAQYAMHKALERAYIHMGELDLGLEQSQCIVMATPGDPEALMRLSGLLAIKGDMPEATAIVNAIADLPMLDTRMRCSLAAWMITLGNYSRADDMYARTAGSREIMSDVYAYLIGGSGKLLKGDKAAADAEFKKASEIKLDGMWPEPVCRYYAGKLSEEELLKIPMAVTNAAKRNHYLCEAYYYTGAKAFAEGNKEKALELFGKCVETKAYNVSELIIAINRMRTLKAGK